MINVLKLKGKMVECDIGQEDISKRLNINRSTFIRKLANGGIGFTVEEVNLIVEILGLSKDEVFSIFFAEIVAKMRQ